MGKSLNIFANTEKNEYLRASCNATRVYFELCSPNDSNTDICVYIVYFVITLTQRIEKSLHIIRVLIRCIQTIGRSIGLRHVRFTFYFNDGDNNLFSVVFFLSSAHTQRCENLYLLCTYFTICRGIILRTFDCAL